MKKRPVSYLFLSALLGTFLGIHFASSSTQLLIAGVVAIVLVLIPNTIVRIIGMLAATLVLCATAALVQRQKYDEAIKLIPPKEANFSGVIHSISPRIDASVSALITITGIDRKPSKPFVMQVTFSEAASTLSFLPKQQILFKALAKPLPKALSDVHFDGYNYGLAHNIHAQAFVKDAPLVFLVTNTQPSLIKRLQMRVWASITEQLTPKESSLLLALMLGDTSLLESNQKELFKELGAQHLLAVSGLQVSLIAFLCFFIFVPLFSILLPLRIAHFAKLMSAIVTLLFIWVFVLLCGCPKSAVRAALMTSFLLSSLGIARDVDAFDAFFLSGLLYILSDPLSPLDLGFLLSYAAVFGILVSLQQSKKMHQFLRQKTFVGAWAFSLVITSVAATLATLPIIACSFFAFAPFSIIANVILVPIATLFQTPAISLGMMGSLFSIKSFITIAAQCSLFIELVAEFLHAVLGEHFFFFSQGKSILFISTCSLFLLFIAILSRKRDFLILSLLGLSAYALEGVFREKKALAITLIPVGQGDATLFRMPGGHHMLIDAGGSMHANFDPGEKYVLPTLRRKGVEKLDVLAITHPDPDHLLGAFAVIDHMPVKEIWIGGFKPDHEQGNRFLKRAAEKNIPVRMPHDLLGSHVFDGCEVQVLAPNSGDNSPNFPELSSNDNSLVIRVLFADKAILWPGDIEYFGEQLLLSDNVEISADLLKAPHHGSKTSSSLEFINKVKPAYVFYSTGFNNRFGFPHDEVTKRYREKDVKDFNTATQGEINVKVDKKGITIQTYAPL